MADVALRGMPDNVHRALKEAAARNHRSLNGEILSRLEASLRPTTADVDTLLARIQERSGRVRLHPLEGPALRSLKEEGRG